MDKSKDLKSVLKYLASIGVERVDVEYDGEGDSGSIQSVEFISKSDYIFSGEILNRDKITTTIENATYAILAEQSLDWVNNDGGYGTVHINTKDLSVTINHEQRITDTESSTYEVQL